MNIAIIPARGGSKRIPRKNIRSFRGKPMMVWSIEVARASGLFDAVQVSTDDPEIAALAKAHGAEVPFFRAAFLADDHAGLDTVVFDHVARLVESGSHPDYCCCLFATAPFVQADLLHEGLRALQTSPHAKFAVAVTSFPFPVQRAVKLDADGFVAPLAPECMRTRSQDLEPAYHEAGQFYWGRTDAFLGRTSIYAPGVSLPVLVPRYRVQDIDTEEDWARAECMHRVLEEMSCK